MYKRGGLVLGFLILFSAVFIALAAAAEGDTNTTTETDLITDVQEDVISDVQAETTAETDIIAEIELEYGDAELEVQAGTTPDSAFYFFDEFFDRFGDDLKVREERIAEVREMIRQGKIEQARRALDNYIELAEKLESESDPVKRDEA